MKSDLNSYLIHLNTIKAQYRKIREVKTKILDGLSRSKFIRIDWPENVKLYQTEQEKSQYYRALSGTITTAVLYDQDIPQSLAGISNVKSKKHQTLYYIIEKMLQDIDLICQTLM